MNGIKQIQTEILLTEDVDREKGIPICEKFALNIKEAAEYFNIGEKKLRSLAEDYGDEISILNGRKVLFKRKKFEEFLNKTSTL